jgi:hypothetical protein
MVSLANRDYFGYATVAVPVPAGVLHDGANMVTVRAGDSVSPTDLANNHDDTLVTWHKRLFSALTPSGVGSPDTKRLWQLAQRFGVELVLDGHDHNYQRLAQNADGKADPNGIREFVVGTGGVGFHTNLTQAPNLDVANADTFGALQADPTTDRL